MSGGDESKGPDFSQGVALYDIRDDGVFGGHVGDEAVILARVEGAIVAVGGACSHYG